MGGESAKLPLLVGRERERSILRRQVHVALTGSPAVVRITGPPGVGKTALARSLRADVERVGGWMTEGQFRRGPGSPYESVLDALAGPLAELASDPATGEGAWDAITNALHSSPGIRRALTSRVHLLADRLLDPPGITPDVDTGAARASLAFRCLSRTLASLRRPLVLLLDDVQWADPPALALLSQLALGPIDGLLLVVTRRGEPVLDPRTPTTELGLGPLSAADVARIVADRGRRDLDECWPLAAVLIEQGGGTPLQVRWLLEQHLQAGRIEDGPEGWIWDLEDLRNGHTGVTTGTVAPARLARLSEGARTVVDLLSVGADALDEDALRQLAGGVAVDVLAEAEEIGLIRPAPGRRWRFAHGRLGEVARQQLSRERRHALRRRLGLALLERGEPEDAPIETLHVAVLCLADADDLSEVDRLRVARVATRAGEHLRALGTLGLARQHFVVAGARFGDRGWAEHRPWMLRAVGGLAQAAALSGDLEDSDATLAILREHDAGLAVEGRVLTAQCAFLAGEGRNLDMFERCDAFLVRAGCEPTPRRFSPVGLAVGFLRTGWALLRAPSDELEAAVEDPALQAVHEAMTVLAATQVATFPHAVLPAVLRDLRLVAADRSTAFAAVPWAGAGLLLVLLGQRRRGRRYLDLSRRIRASSAPSTRRDRISLSILMWIEWRVRSVRDCLAEAEPSLASLRFVDGHELGWQLWSDLLGARWVTGNPLPELLASTREAIEAAVPGVEPTAQQRLLADLAESLRCLRDARPPAADRWLRTAGEAAQGASLAATTVFSLWTAAGAAGVLGFADSAERWRTGPAFGPAGMAVTAWLAVARCEALRLGTGTRRGHRRAVSRARRDLLRWAGGVPARGFRLDWVEGALADADGRSSEALDILEHALQGARAADSTPDVLLLLEHCASLAERLGQPEKRDGRLQQAIAGYAAWGAPGQVRRLRALVDPPDGLPAPTSNAVLEIVRGTRAIAAEVLFERVLEQLIAVVEQRSGASEAAVALTGPSGLRLVARWTAGEAVELSADESDLDSTGLPVATLMTALATSSPEVVLVPDDHEAARWGLCAPLRNGDSSVGVLFLAKEPGQAAFDERTAEEVGLYAAQAATSLSIARIHGALKSEGQQRAHELDDAYRRVEAANRTKGELIASMSHELKTPLNAILGGAEHLLMHPSLARVDRQAVQSIRSSGRHLLGLIEDVLDLARMDARDLELDIAPHDLQELVRGCIDMVGEMAQRRGIALASEVSAGAPPDIDVDGKRLRQVLVNLLTNGIKMTEEGEVRLKVHEVRTADDRGGLRFEVCDTGPGVAEDDRQRIFQAFEQGLVHRTGSGLGLAISERLVRAMGSRIQLQNREEGGARFWFDLGLPEGHGTTGAHAVTMNLPPLDEDLPAPPPDAIAQLLHFADRGNLSRVASLSRELAEADTTLEPLADRLEALASQFDDVAILALLDELEEKAPS